MSSKRGGCISLLHEGFQLVEGPHSGKTVYTRLNLKNKNPLAERLSHEELARICRAVGVLQPKDSNQLHENDAAVSIPRL